MEGQESPDLVDSERDTYINSIASHFARRLLTSSVVRNGTRFAVFILSNGQSAADDSCAVLLALINMLPAELVGRRKWRVIGLASWRPGVSFGLADHLTAEYFGPVERADDYEHLNNFAAVSVAADEVPLVLMVRYVPDPINPTDAVQCIRFHVRIRSAAIPHALLNYDPPGSLAPSADTMLTLRRNALLASSSTSSSSTSPPQQQVAVTAALESLASLWKPWTRQSVTQHDPSTANDGGGGSSSSSNIVTLVDVARDWGLQYFPYICNAMSSAFPQSSDVFVIAAYNECVVLLSQQAQQANTAPASTAQYTTVPPRASKLSVNVYQWFV